MLRSERSPETLSFSHFCRGVVEDATQSAPVSSRRSSHRCPYSGGRCLHIEQHGRNLRHLLALNKGYRSTWTIRGETAWLPTSHAACRTVHRTARRGVVNALTFLRVCPLRTAWANQRIRILLRAPQAHLRHKAWQRRGGHTLLGCSSVPTCDPNFHHFFLHAVRYRFPRHSLGDHHCLSPAKYAPAPYAPRGSKPPHRRIVPDLSCGSTKTPPS